MSFLPFFGSTLPQIIQQKITLASKFGGDVLLFSGFFDISVKLFTLCRGGSLHILNARVDLFGKLLFEGSKTIFAFWKLSTNIRYLVSKSRFLADLTFNLLPTRVPTPSALSRASRLMFFKRGIAIGPEIKKYIRLVLHLSCILDKTNCHFYQDVFISC